ncbi:MAG TPA: RNA methyltransferase [Candidatus Nanopelagicaceae bacterium]|nr:RNA methyltransferase [Candidatus Nanopelagicaceae bacterium]
MTEQSPARSARIPGPTSPRSTRVIAVRGLAKRNARRESGTFLAEGPQAVREALAWGKSRGQVVDLFATEDALLQFDFLAETEFSITIVGAEILNAMADTVTPQGVIAVCTLPSENLDSIFARSDPKLIAIMSNVRDPGNVGTVIRSADATGADGVIISSESVDPWSPKAVRSSAGSLWHLPVVADVDLSQAISEISVRGFQVLAADSSGQVGLDELESTGKLKVPTAWLFGNEAWGLPDAIRAQADQVVSLPIFGNAESLNLSMAATLALYSSARAQRRA